jgi:NADPH:quinone reductase
VKYVVATRFGGPEVLEVREAPTPEPGPGEVRVRMTSIGMNHAELMARRGEYKLMSGDPPFIPGIEGGGVIDAVGPQTNSRHIGQRVILGADAPRQSSDPLGGGTYRSHYIIGASKTIPAPTALPDAQLGAVWLPYLTAWGCLIWRQDLKRGQFVALPAASSSVALAASQIAKHRGAITIGMTTSEEKVATLRSMPEAAYDHLLLTRDTEGRETRWYKQLKQITDGKGIDVFFDPVAAGSFLDNEVRGLANHGTIWVYGLLGEPGVVDVTPLIRKHGAIRGWVLGEIVKAGRDVLEQGYAGVLAGFQSGVFRLRVAATYPLDEVQRAHAEMEAGRHIGKLVLLP